jgi:hypothetical protein
MLKKLVTALALAALVLVPAAFADAVFHSTLYGHAPHLARIRRDLFSAVRRRTRRDAVHERFGKRQGRCNLPTRSHRRAGHSQLDRPRLLHAEQQHGGRVYDGLPDLAARQSP